MRYAWITRHKRQWPISLQCEVLGVSASGYFEHVAWGESKEPSKPGRRLSDEAVLAHIKAAHAGSKGEYGWPRIWKELLAKGVRVGKDRIQKLMTAILAASIRMEDQARSRVPPEPRHAQRIGH